MTDPDPKIPAFVNPEARNADAATASLAGDDRFDVLPVPPAEIAARVREAIQRGATRVVVAGGDGSLRGAATVLAGSGAELAILPAGTLNHLARDLGLPLDLDEATRLAGSEEATTCVDVGDVNGRVFLNTSSVGAYAAFVRLRERLEPRVGYVLASLVAGVRLLFRLRLFRVSLEIDGKVREYVTPLVFIGVGERELRLPSLGSRVEGGRPGLHVIVVRSRTGARVLALALAAAARGIRAVSRTPHLDAFLVDRCRIDAPFAAVAVDGEIVTIAPPLEYVLRPRALSVVVTPEQPPKQD